jgi:hypothetical protein
MKKIMPPACFRTVKNVFGSNSTRESWLHRGLVVKVILILMGCGLLNVVII